MLNARKQIDTHTSSTSCISLRSWAEQTRAHHCERGEQDKVVWVSVMMLLVFNPKYVMRFPRKIRPPHKSWREPARVKKTVKILNLFVRSTRWSRTYKLSHTSWYRANQKPRTIRRWLCWPLSPNVWRNWKKSCCMHFNFAFRCADTCSCVRLSTLSHILARKPLICLGQSRFPRWAYLHSPMVFQQCHTLILRQFRIQSCGGYVVLA